MLRLDACFAASCILAAGVAICSNIPAEIRIFNSCLEAEGEAVDTVDQTLLWHPDALQRMPPTPHTHTRTMLATLAQRTLSAPTAGARSLMSAKFCFTLTEAPTRPSGVACQSPRLSMWAFVDNVIERPRSERRPDC